jgi:hypothetical protein
MWLSLSLPMSPSALSLDEQRVPKKIRTQKCAAVSDKTKDIHHG